MKINHKISLSFFAVAFLLASTSVVFLYAVSKGILLKSIHDNFNAVIESRTDLIEFYLKVLQSSVVSTSKSVVLPNLLRISKEDPRYQEAFETAVKLLKQKKDFDTSVYEYMIVDKSGTVVASTDETSIGEDKSTDTFFLGAQKDAYIKDVYFSPGKNMPLIAVSTPFLDSDTGAFLGVFVARVKLDDLYGIVMDRTGLGKTGEMYLVNRHGYMITPSRFKEDTFLKQRVDTESTRSAWLNKDRENALPKNEPLKVFRDYRGVNVLGTYRYLPLMQWCVLAEIDEKEAFAPLAIIRISFSIVLVLVPALAWLMGVAIAKSITEPIHKLHKGTEIIGSGNLDYKVGTDAQDEVGQLSRAFDQMSEDLKKTTTSIDILNREIAQRKQLQYELSENEAKYRTLYDSSGDAIMLLIPGERFIGGNPATIKLFGCKDEKEFLIHNPASLSPEYQPDGVSSDVKSRQMLAIAAEKGSHFFEWKHKRLNGEEFFATVLLTKMKLGNREIVQATVRDITKQKLMEEKIAATAREWESTFNSIPDFVSIQDRDSRLVRVNKAYADFFRMKQEEVVGRQCFSVVHGTNGPCFDCPQERTIESGKVQRLEYFEPRFGLYLEVSTSPIFGANNEVTGTVHVVKDITVRKKMEDTLKEAAELKSHFTSMVSHELRTPLTAIKESISIVLEEAAGKLNDEQKDFLGMSRRNVERLSRLINDVLDYQKLESGKFEFNMQERDMNGLIKEVQNTMASVAKNKGLDIFLDLDENLPQIKFDSDKIIQVLTNLINNAIKFTEKGNITIISSRKDNSVQIGVKDTGPGIKEQDLTRLFLAFEQLEQGKDRKTGGTGLGLAISKEIVEKHKGKIWVESELGKGTTFWFILPVKTKDKVLVIDDDGGVLDAIRKFLEKEGYIVTVSEKGLDAIEIMQKDKPDLVILDMKLKDTTGYEVIGRMKSNKQTLKIPIVAISGYPAELTRVKDEKGELILASLAKPFDMKDLLSVVRAQLK